MQYTNSIDTKMSKVSLKVCSSWKWSPPKELRVVEERLRQKKKKHSQDG